MKRCGVRALPHPGSRKCWSFERRHGNKSVLPSSEGRRYGRERTEPGHRICLPFTHAITVKGGSDKSGPAEVKTMNNIIYIVGFVVIVIFILGFLGLR